MYSKEPKIVVIPGWFPSFWHPTSGDFVLYQSELLYKAGLDIEVLELDLNYRYISKPTCWLSHYSSYTSSKGLKIHRMRGLFLPRFHPWIIHHWAKNFVNLFERQGFQHHDRLVLHAHNYLGALGAYQISKKWNIPYVITEHSSFFLEDNVPKYHKPILEKVFQNASKVFAVSRALRNKLEPIVGRSVELFPNFIDTDIFSIQKNKETTFSFVFVGDLSPIKRIDLLLESYKKSGLALKGISQLFIIGSGSEDQKLKYLTKSLQIEETVHFLGYLAPTKLRSKLGACHCLVLPSDFETFGIVLVEAFSSGIPVIASKCGGPQDIVKEDTGILVEKGNLSVFSEAMNSVYHGYSDYKPEEIRKYAVNRFGTKQAKKRLKQLYQELLDANISL